MHRILFLLCCVPLPSFGQATTAQFDGRISDSSGAPVPSARIVVINAGTAARREASSNETGNYTVPLLEPGAYSITVEKEGFSSATQSGLTLHVEQSARIDFTLQVGAVKQTVAVTADAPLLQESEASLGTVIENRNIVDMPLNGRNPFDLMFLAPGAVQYERLDLRGAR